MKIQRQIGNRGFTLVELMIVIVIIGVLAALASFGFMQYVKKSKTAEADEFVKKIGDGAKIYYTTEQKYGGDEAGWHAPGGTPGTGAGYPVPFDSKVFPGGDKNIATHPDPPKGGGKLLPAPEAGDKIVWTLLKFTTSDPTYFRYLYKSESAGTGAKAYVVGEADFDSDGVKVSDPAGDMTQTANHTLKKELVIANGDVQATPAVTTNEFK